jgi:DNA-binding NtrC family response regulator
MMPKLDGIEVLRRIRAIDKDIAVVIFTAHPNLDSAVASMKLDAVDYIKKPFNADEFREVLSRVMRKKGLARTPEEQLHRVIAAGVDAREHTVDGVCRHTVSARPLSSERAAASETRSASVACSAVPCPG